MTEEVSRAIRNISVDLTYIRGSIKDIAEAQKKLAYEEGRKADALMRLATVATEYLALVKGRGHVDNA